MPQSQIFQIWFQQPSSSMFILTSVNPFSLATSSILSQSNVRIFLVVLQLSDVRRPPLSNFDIDISLLSVILCWKSGYIYPVTSAQRSRILPRSLIFDTIKLHCVSDNSSLRMAYVDKISYLKIPPSSKLNTKIFSTACQWLAPSLKSCPPSLALVNW